jgi:hypothetical protein
MANYFAQLEADDDPKDLKFPLLLKDKQILPDGYSTDDLIDTYKDMG